MVGRRLSLAVSFIVACGGGGGALPGDGGSLPDATLLDATSDATANATADATTDAPTDVASGRDAASCHADRPDGACLVYTPPSGQSAQNPCYSPDSARLLLTLFHGGYNTGTAALLTLPAVSGAIQTVIDDNNTNVNLPGSSWNGPAGRITFTSDAFGAEEVMTIAPDGTSILRVTNHASPNYFEPSFSPDGRTIVFEANYSSSSAEIWKAAADGSAPPTRLTSGQVDRQPNWSPAGDRILFQRLAPGWAIYTMNVDGSNVTRVTPAADSSTDASFSPDGRRIVYSTSRGGVAGANVWVIDVSGSVPPVRVTTSQGYDGAPTWSPDGLWIAFESSPDPSGTASTAIWRISAP